ncbi:hypothetical protein BSF38_00577 [Paludisphaera borealis]|uniref:DUF1553 domain-containing protein n=2 Tax=Paludisphaera borealis TaxID=1387353 RepID=A0A1U7CJU8_9BACT|nr:hypothetical protein BSF38_00577 [Paludisphaera borealis]
MRHGPRLVTIAVWSTFAVACFASLREVPGADPKPAAAKTKATASSELTAVIDKTFEDAWAKANVRPAPSADDAEFVRRVYLDLVGKIPRVYETLAFLDDPAPTAEKRAKLVEMLLESPAYLSRATETYRAMLLPEAETDAQVRNVLPTFEAWLRKKVVDNAGYDKIVREVLTVSLGGRGRRAGNALDPRASPSPLAFYIAKDAKPENLAASASRLFLGVRMECAQCHNHPFSHWKREEFWGLAVFFGGVTRQGGNQAFGQIRENESPREMVIPGTTRVARAALPGEAETKWRRGASGREVLADWITAPDNPYFARAAVNRVWARFFGVGLVEPVDDLRDENPSAHPELHDRLAREFREHGYDLKYLIRAITASKPYGLTSAVGRSELAPPQLFAAMPLRSLSPDQLFDSLSQATGLGTTGQDMIGGDARSRFSELFANRDEKSTEGQVSILQALSLMNGPLITSATSPETGNTLAAVVDSPFLDTAGKIESLYLSALSRRPRADESAAMTAFVQQGKSESDRAKALGDVFWALLNSPEFRFNH